MICSVYLDVVISFFEHFTVFFSKYAKTSYYNGTRWHLKVWLELKLALFVPCVPIGHSLIKHQHTIN